MLKFMKNEKHRLNYSKLCPAQALCDTKHSILGILFDLISYESVLKTIEHWRQTGEKQYITLAPPYSVLLGDRDAEMNVAMDRAGLVLPDGVGIILAANILNYKNNGRITGPLLMLKTCDWGRQYGYRHYFYGGAEGVVERLVDRLSQIFPGIQIAGTYSPPFQPLSEKEDQAIVEKINATNPDIVWVGLGTRKQEMWMAEHLGKIKATAMIGVGQAFDIHSGMIKWAPARIRKVGLEWAYRLAKEPKRLWRRNLEAPTFVYKVICQRLRKPDDSLSFHGRIQAEKNIRRHRDLPKRDTSIGNVLSIDVEDWFHILNDRAVPKAEHWGSLESRIERNIDQILELLHNQGIRATFFWLGWLAERNKSLLRRCYDEGHEIASHSYNHVLPWKVGAEGFKDDITRAKKILEDIIGEEVRGFRTAGFGITDHAKWAFDVIAEVGYEYDSSIAPPALGRNNKPPCKNSKCAALGRNNVPACQSGICIMDTQKGPLIEIPVSAFTLFGFRLGLFGGGYLRFLPKWFIRSRTEKLYAAGRPLILYVHPREFDPDHPRLPLEVIRYFRSYYNLKSTLPKLQWLCENNNFIKMHELVDQFLAR